MSDAPWLIIGLGNPGAEYEATLAAEGMQSLMNPELYTGAAADDEGGGPQTLRVIPG